MTLAGQTCLGKPGHLPGGGGKVLVAPAAPATLAENKGLLVRHILDDFSGFGIPDESASGYADGQAFAVLAAFAPALTVYAVSCHIFALVAKVHQGRHVVVHLHDDAAAVAAVAAVRAAGGNIFFPVKGHRPVAAVAGANGDAGLVNKSICHIIYLIL